MPFCDDFVPDPWLLQKSHDHISEIFVLGLHTQTTLAWITKKNGEQPATLDSTHTTRFDLILINLWDTACSASQRCGCGKWDESKRVHDTFSMVASHHQLNIDAVQEMMSDIVEICYHTEAGLIIMNTWFQYDSTTITTYKSC